MMPFKQFDTPLWTCRAIKQSGNSKIRDYYLLLSNFISHSKESLFILPNVCILAPNIHMYALVSEPPTETRYIYDGILGSFRT